MKLQRHQVSGSDCLDFFHRQVTADVHALEENRPTLTAWCNIQGRVSSLMWITKQANALELLIPDESYAKAMPRLKMFVLRDDVVFSGASAVYGSVSKDGLTLSETRTEDWKEALVENGIPHLNSDACDSYLPQMLNLDCINGLSFSKGCYPGQEIVARTHFRGKLKQRLLRLKTDIAEGNDIYNAEQGKAGTSLLQSNGEALAVIRLDALEGGLFDSKSQPIEQLALPYAIPELS